jgi:transcription antitermination factor NusG
LSISEPLWYALHTRSNCEQKVARELAMREFESYVPIFRELHQWRDRKKLVELPLFPGYVFVRLLDCAAARLEVMKIASVVRILGQGERIEPVAEEEIAGLQRLLVANAHCLAHPLLREGAWVRVRRGALEGLEGLLVAVKGRTRLVLSITLLSQSVSTEIDASDVEYLRSTSGATLESSTAHDRHAGLTSAVSAARAHSGALNQVAFLPT